MVASANVPAKVSATVRVRIEPLRTMMLSTPSISATTGLLAKVSALMESAATMATVSATLARGLPS
jgi:hypothetical protein